MEPVWCIVLALAALAGGSAVGYLFARTVFRSRLVISESRAVDQRETLRRQAEEADAKSKDLVVNAQREAERITKESELKAKDELYRKREEFNRDTEQARLEMREQERRLEKREDAAEEKVRQLTKKERDVESARKKFTEKKEALEKREVELEELIAKQLKELHEISGMSREEGEKKLLEHLERGLANEFATRIARYEDRLKSDGERRARDILATAIQRYASAHTADTTVSTVDIPSDDMKGRIIGREGRNIRTFEKCTGVDVIVDDTPGVVIVSAFDNVRRETARLALTKLIQDGRIHPTRIEEVVLETQKEMDKRILEIGLAAVTEADVGAPVHEKLMQLLGRLKFRTSYSQNVLQHSLEVCHLCGMMAAELGLNAQLARRCALLHDIGKAADHEMEGGHPKIGAELAKRYGETSKEVLHAIQGHHDEVTIDHIYTVLVAAADAITPPDPVLGETLEKYVKRLEELEAIACGFPGIDQAFAIQAGRELRVIADAGRTTDAQAIKMCRDIAVAIEEKMDYPGEIKVTVVRELRAIEFAR